MKRLALAILLIPILLSAGLCQEVDQNLPIAVFHSPSCQRCVEVKRDVIPLIEKEFEGNISITYLDITIKQNYELLLSLEQKYTATIKNAWPVIFVNGQFISGSEDVRARLEELIIEVLYGEGRYREEGLPKVNLLQRFLTRT